MKKIIYMEGSRVDDDNRKKGVIEGIIKRC